MINLLKSIYATVTLELLHYMQHQITSKCYNYKVTYVVTHKYTAKKCTL